MPNPKNHPQLFSLSDIPHSAHQQILLVRLQNPNASHHLHSCHPDASYQQTLPRSLQYSLVLPVSTLVCLVCSQHSSQNDPIWSQIVTLLLKSPLVSKWQGPSDGLPGLVWTHPAHQPHCRLGSLRLKPLFFWGHGLLSLLLDLCSN